MFWSVLGRGGGPRGVQPKNEMTRLMARQPMNNGEKKRSQPTRKNLKNCN